MIDLSLEQLRGMIGVRVRHHGEEWRVVEVLEDGPSLVLESCSSARVIQPDRHGGGGRRVPEHTTVPVLEDGRRLHPDFLDLELLDH